ncbi:MAG: hypothetical protein OEY33_09950, partial [Bdellovibrionales bacterium]|nr:hypothetical protein [Bdellovibrionales bacterium]
LEKCIYEIYEKISRPTLSDFNNLLKNHPEREINIFSQSLYSWTGNTAYGEMIDGKTNIDLSKDLVTIETRGLDDHPELQNIFMLLLTDRIKNDASLDSSRPYLLIIDEAWKLFQTPSGMMFALEAYRTFRKFKGGIWCISQNYKDFLSNQEIKNALLPNTANVFILKQRKIDWKDFKESMDFNHEEVEAIKSLEVIKGAYSEFFFLQDDNRAILRMTPDPLSYWICTSDGDDRAQIKDLELKRPNLSKIEILELLAFGKKEERILKIK